MAFDLQHKVFYYRIKLFKNSRAAGPDLVLFWKDHNFSRFTKWLWFMKYRAALLQVEFPKAIVEIKTGSWTNPTEEERFEIDKTRLKNRIIARKRKITEWSNKLEKFKKAWDEKNESELFKNPYEIDPYYSKVVQKIRGSKQQLQDLELEYKNLTLN